MTGFFFLMIITSRFCILMIYSSEGLVAWLALLVLHYIPSILAGYDIIAIIVIKIVFKYKDILLKILVLEYISKL